MYSWYRQYTKNNEIAARDCKCMDCNKRSLHCKYGYGKSQERKEWHQQKKRTTNRAKTRLIIIIMNYNIFIWFWAFSLKVGSTPLNHEQASFYYRILPHEPIDNDLVVQIACVLYINSCFNVGLSPCPQRARCFPKNFPYYPDWSIHSRQILLHPMTKEKGWVQ